MNYDPTTHHRRSIRLPAYDYAQPGAYFVTLVTQARESLFGQVIDGEMRLNGLGDVVAQEWRRTGEMRDVGLDLFVVMPNHAHGILIVVGAHSRAPEHDPPEYGVPLYRPPRSLGSLVAGFKSAVTKRINGMRGTPGLPVWQRNYYEHVIRDEEELNRIREYVASNPTHWEEDPENPDCRPRHDQPAVTRPFL